MRFKTIREGEQAVIFNYMGEGRLVKGPVRVFLFRERLEKLTCYYASQYQYLEVTFNTGSVKHIRGPCEMFFNPMEHSRIATRDAIKIDANHMVVVYQSLKNRVERRIIQGPQLFVPAAEEWLHNFSWHGQDRNRVGHMIPDHEKFVQLAAIPQQFYYDVRDVRTNDDTMLTVKLMIFYELKDVIRMLEMTQDPIADMINFQRFLEATSELSELTAFPQLVQRSDRIGYLVSKVVYRGYQSSSQLQTMQDNAVQARTKLRLQAELQEQEQKLADFKLKREKDRIDLKQNIEHQKLEHQQKIESLVKSHEMSIENNELNTRLECEAYSHQVKLAYAKNCSEQQVCFLQSLHALNTNLTEYLVHNGPSKVHEELQLIQPAETISASP
ncbi:hypothetical protein LSH36_5g17031 [Paralvinella palmiformis]|uniref:Band 7 domain-containing protein n=1 Tax=Paralvinella palmiformis TaxID=53620 RepID=A0AAD9KE28_9ANNE|nr:hypothetical protein LSH36_5g17031 [Paralvinella palmiformis]